MPMAAMRVGAKANISFFSNALKHAHQLTTPPHTHYPYTSYFPQQPQHCKPAIYHKVIIELSIGKQLTPPTLLPPPLPIFQFAVRVARGGGGILLK